MELKVLLASQFILPSIPRVVALLLSELDKDEPDLMKVSQLISTDPALTTRLLQISKQGRQPKLSLTPQPFRFRLLESSLPNTDGMRLPCRTRTGHRGKVVFVTRPSSDSPRTLPRAFY